MAIVSAILAKPGPPFLLSPRRLWWRACLFQMHLWVGLIAALYICLVGTTGSILVFEDELYRLSRPSAFIHLSPVPADLATHVPGYLNSARRAFAGNHFSSIYLPRHDQPIVVVEGEPDHRTGFNNYVLVYLDPASARVLGMTDSHFWVAWIRELHVRLLSGRTGAVINGCGASCLLVLALSGIVIWWPGLKHWSRALKVDFRRRLPRINFDLHSAIGFWGLLFVAVWAISGIYFSWPKQFITVLDFFTPAKSAAYPSVRVAPHSQGTADLLPMIRKAESLLPGSRMVALDLPETSADPLGVIVSNTGKLERSTYFFFDPYSARVLQKWERGPGSTLGSSIVYWLGPLHFGESWGLFFKAVWSLFGLSLPALAVTGMLMYWNRFLGKRLRVNK